MLQIDESRVRQAAKDCPDAKKVLETLFPEVFENKVDKFENLKRICDNGKKGWIGANVGGICYPFEGQANITIMRHGDEDCIFLSPDYNWKIHSDYYLIPTKP
jgi:hypothetical protein